MTIEQRCIAEYWRQYEIFKQAEKAQIESVMLACLASMNTIVKIWGYTPEP